MIQKIFSRKYVDSLRNELKFPHGIEKYKKDNFEYDDKCFLILPGISRPENLSEKIKTDKTDFENAVLLYESYENLTPLMASDERFWVYLTHVDLYSYMIQRWPGMKDKENKDNKNKYKYINDHWFIGGVSQANIMRNALSGLWWAVHISVDKSNTKDKYELTKVLFRNLDFPTRTLGTYKLGRHKEAVMGILQFIKEHDDIFNEKKVKETGSFQEETRAIVKYFNRLGGIKPLSYYNREFFINELSKYYEKKIESANKIKTN